MNKKQGFFLLKIVFGIGLFYLFIRKTDLSFIFSALRGVSAQVVLAAIFIDLLALWLAAVKWSRLIPSVSFSRIFSVSLLGRFYSFVLPGQIAGESLKAYHLGSREKNLEESAASVIMDKLSGIAGVFIVAAAGVFFSRKNIPPVFMAVFFGATAALVGLIFSLGTKPVQRLISHFKFHISAAVLKKYTGNKTLIFFQLFLGTLYQAGGILIMTLFGAALGIPLGWADYCWIGGAVSLALLLPLTIGGLGIREGAFIGLLGWLGVEKEKALALSLAFFAVQVFDAALGGVIFLKEIIGGRAGGRQP